MKSVPRTAQTAAGVRTSNFLENFFTQERTRPKYSPSETASLLSDAILKAEAGASWTFVPSSMNISTEDALAVRSSSPEDNWTLALPSSFFQPATPLFFICTSPRHCAI